MRLMGRTIELEGEMIEEQKKEAIAEIMRAKSFIVVTVYGEEKEEEGGEGREVGSSVMSCAGVRDAVNLHYGYIKAQQQFIGAMSECDS